MYPLTRRACEADGQVNESQAISQPVATHFRPVFATRIKRECHSSVTWRSRLMLSTTYHIAYTHTRGGDHHTRTRMTALETEIVITIFEFVTYISY